MEGLADYFKPVRKGRPEKFGKHSADITNMYEKWWSRYELY